MEGRIPPKAGLIEFCLGRISPPWAEVDMYYVYIIWSAKLQKKYVGVSKDLKVRLKEHNSGKSDFTNRGKPWKLLYYEAFLSKEDAESEELFLKSGKGRERIKYLLKNSLGGVA